MTMLVLLLTLSQTWMAEHCPTQMRDLLSSRQESTGEEVESGTVEVAAHAEKVTKMFVTTATRAVTGK
jgi:hypothetical protein